jgi:hypothetical protein
MNIEFLPSSEEVHNLIEPPQPGKSTIPQWFKDMPGFNPARDPLMFDNEGTLVNKHLKMCMPFIDAITGGFVQKTWCDIYIKPGDNRTATYNWAHNPAPLGDRGKCNVPISDKYYPLEFHWIVPWIPKLPDGYSLLITHPHNRLDLPFTTLSGIIDADKFHHVGFGQYPFYIDHNFEGIIPFGTPMFQMIPFKRDDWKSTIKEFNIAEQKKKSYLSLREYWSVYKNHFWQKKKYD